MEDKHWKAFREYSKRLKEEFDSVIEVRLFGSVARNSHGPRSDVDVLIIVSGLSEREEIEDLAFKMTTEFGVSITPIVVEENAPKEGVVKTAMKKGVEHVPT